MGNDTMAKKKKPVCKCEKTLKDIELLKRRQDVLMDGHIYLAKKINDLHPWQLIKNFLKRKKT